MEKDVVPYDMALRLKALGFDEPCSAYYLSDGLFCDLKIRRQTGDSSLAPTFSQAFRFFRENYKMKFYIREDIWNDWCTVKILSRREYDNDYIDEGDYKTYPEAELACLRRLIEIVKS